MAGDSLAEAEVLLAEASRLEGLVDELSSATARLSDVWVGPSQQRLETDFVSQAGLLRDAVSMLRSEAAALIGGVSDSGDS